MRHWYVFHKCCKRNSSYTVFHIPFYFRTHLLFLTHNVLFSLSSCQIISNLPLTGCLHCAQTAMGIFYGARVKRSKPT